MQNLNISTETLDQDNTFVIEVVKPRRTVRITAVVQRDYQKVGDGILWAMKKSAALKSQYTEKDTEERNRLNTMEPIRTGDTVLIEGKQYTARIKGDFSDCAIFDPITA